MPRPLLIPCLLLATCLLTGCLQRHVSIESDPSGALVYANDVELGRTPLTASFTYYGDYDVRVEKEGYEPRRIRAAASAPIYEYPPFDLIANAIPADMDHEVKWRFKLEPTLESTQSKEQLEADLINRAKQLRGDLK